MCLPRAGPQVAPPAAAHSPPPPFPPRATTALPPDSPRAHLTPGSSSDPLKDYCYLWKVFKQFFWFLTKIRSKAKSLSLGCRKPPGGGARIDCVASMTLKGQAAAPGRVGHVGRWWYHFHPSPCDPQDPVLGPPLCWSAASLRSELVRVQLFQVLDLNLI